MSPASMHLAGLSIHEHRNKRVFRVESKHLTNYIKERIVGKIIWKNIQTNLGYFNNSVRQAF